MFFDGSSNGPSLLGKRMLCVRPKVAELVFRVYGRPLHPELFEVAATRTEERENFSATLSITNTGHIFSWHRRGQSLTELATSALCTTPRHYKLLGERFRGERRKCIDLGEGVTYECTFQTEPVEPKLFWTFQEELAQQTVHDGMMYKFGASGRMALGAISYVHLQTRRQSLRIRAFHTFPDDCALVKTHSMVRFPID
jgi:hypothetical protein